MCFGRLSHFHQIPGAVDPVLDPSVFPSRSPSAPTTPFSGAGGVVGRDTGGHDEPGPAAYAQRVAVVLAEERVGVDVAASGEVVAEAGVLGARPGAGGVEDRLLVDVLHKIHMVG